jgi:hypothetical protein
MGEESSVGDEEDDRDTQANEEQMMNGEAQDPKDDDEQNEHGALAPHPPVKLHRTPVWS